MPQNKTLEHLIRYQKAYLPLLLIITFLFLYFLRYLHHNPTIISPSSYYHLTAASSFSWHLLYQNPYHFFLSFNFTHHPFLYLALSFLLALSSLFLLFNLLPKFRLNPTHQFFFLFFLLFSPAFIYTYTTLTYYSFIIFLLLLGFYLWLKKEELSIYPALFAFAFIPFFDVFSSILTLLLLTIYFYFKKDYQIRIPAVLISLLTFLNIFLKKPFLLGPYAPQNLLLDFFSDFGSLFGFSLFALLLAFVGFFATWKKKEIYLFYLFLLFFLALFFYQTSALIYLAFPLAFFASAGFLYFLNKEWKLRLIKNAFLFLLLLGLLFSVLVALDNFISSPPDAATKESLLWLRDNLSAYRLIFSHPQDSYLVEYFARKPAFIHYHDSNFKNKLKTADHIFQSTYIKETFPLLEQNALSHIYLSSQTKAELPTSQGLIFVLQNERFKRLYNKSNIEVWEFRKEE